MDPIIPEQFVDDDYLVMLHERLRQAKEQRKKCEMNNEMLESRVKCLKNEEEKSQFETQSKLSQKEEEIKLNASMGLVSNLAGNDNNGNPNMDYITGVNGSKILYATICDIILEQAKDNDAMLVVPQDSIGTVGQYKVIISTDLNSLVVGIDSLGLIIILLLHPFL